MNTTRNKYLTEAIGELPEDNKCLPCDGGCQGSGGCHSAMSFRGMLYIDFSTWDAFGKLKEYISTTDHNAEFCDYFFDKTFPLSQTAEAFFDFVCPDDLANTYCEFLKERNG